MSVFEIIAEEIWKDLRNREEFRQYISEDTEKRIKIRWTIIIRKHFHKYNEIVAIWMEFMNREDINIEKIFSDKDNARK